MRNLLCSHFCRLRRNLVFYICLLLCAAQCLDDILGACIGAARYADATYHLEQYTFGNLPLFSVAIAVFASLFFGTEYADGTIRNKLICGHSRGAVYFSSYLTLLAGALAIYGIVLLGEGFGRLEPAMFRVSGWNLAVYIALGALSIASLCALLTMVNLLVQNRAACAVASILLVLFLVILTSALYNALCAPEMVGGMVYDEQGLHMVDPYPNPHYVSGTLRQVYLTIVQAIPVGQQVLLSNTEVLDPFGTAEVAVSASRMAIYGLGLTVAALVGGYALFRRKDLK